MPATSIFMSAPSGGMSGIGNSWISVLLGPTLTAASAFSIRFPKSERTAHPKMENARPGFGRPRAGPLAALNRFGSGLHRRLCYALARDECFLRCVLERYARRQDHRRGTHAMMLRIASHGQRAG